jgi:hypothetical protein
MCGFLLRGVFLSLVLYLLFGIEAGIHIVTLGGQILGASLVGLFTACYHTIGRHLFTHVWIGRIVAAIWAGLTVIVVARLLPGYTVTNPSVFSYIVSVFCLIAWTIDNFIKDK